MVIWLIGLSGSGKTTLGREIAQQWRKKSTNVVFLDGDELREIFRSDHGAAAYSVEGRRENAERAVRLCQLLDRQGVNVVCCILSIFGDMRVKNRSRFTKYFEIFMDAPMDVLRRRDVKGLYAAHKRGEVSNVVGIDIPFDTPTTSDIVIDTSGSEPALADLAALVLTKATSQ